MIPALVLAATLLAPVPCTPLPTCLPDFSNSPCATPTPVLEWDLNSEPDLKGYQLFVGQPGDQLQLVADLPCELTDLDGDGTAEHRFCRGAHLGIPLQRHCPACAPLFEYEFGVKAVDTAGNLSDNFLAIIPVCFSQLCAPPGPCN